MKKIIIILISLFLLTSCYDYQELVNLNIVSGIGIDYENNEYVVTLEIINSSKKNAENEIKTTILTGKDKELSKAFTKAKEKSSKEIYLKHIELLLLSKNICKHGIKEVLSYLLNDIYTNNDYYVIVVNNPNDILNIKLDNKTITNNITNYLNYTIKNHNLDDIFTITKNIIENKKSTSIPYLNVNKDNITMNKIACFNKDKLTTTINSKIYKLLILKDDNLNFNIDNNTINIYKIKPKYKIKKNKIIITINCKGRIIMNKKTNSLSNLNKQLKKQIKKEINKFIKNANTNNIDILGLKDTYYKKYNLTKNNIPYKIIINSKITKQGNLYEELYD